MCKFGRVTFRLARDTVDTELVNLSRRLRRQYNGKAELFEERSPERIILVHVQNTWNTNRSAGRFLCGKRFVVKQSLVFIFK